jgi:hypothetical protein
MLTQGGTQFRIVSSSIAHASSEMKGRRYRSTIQWGWKLTLPVWKSHPDIRSWLKSSPYATRFRDELANY